MSSQGARAPAAGPGRLTLASVCVWLAVALGATAETETTRCTIVAPRVDVEAGQTVWLEGHLSGPPERKVFYRWHLGGGLDRTLAGEAHGAEPIAVAVVFERTGQAFPVTLTLTDGRGRLLASCRASIVVGHPPLEEAGLRVSEEDPPEDPVLLTHSVLAFNDIGMHAMDLGSVPFALRPPLNTIHAQVVERGAAPRLADESEVVLRYSAASSATDPILSPLSVELDGLPPIEGTQTFAARELLSAAGVAIAPGAEVTFASGRQVILADGFTVADSAIFQILIDPVLEAPSINSTSRHDPPGAPADAALTRKCDLWDPVDQLDPLGPTVVAALFGVDVPPDQGLPTVHNPTGGRRMPGIADPYVANTPQPFSSFDGATGRFLAEGVPLTPVDDAGRLNPYPLMRLQALDSSSGELLAAVDAVAAVSTEVDCRDCHLRGGIGADPAARAPEIPFVEPALYGDPFEEERAAKRNILLLHDFKWGTAHAGGPPVLCARCHESRTLEAIFPVLDASEPPHLSLSNVMHDQHGRFVVDAVSEELVRDTEGEPILRTVPETGERFLLVSDPADPAIGMEQNCFACHPGHSTSYFRGVMADPGGLKCSSCHGNMLAVGALFPGDFDQTGQPRSRRPWRDEPRCESCHLGDAVDPGPTDLPGRVAFDLLDPAAVPRIAANRRFAENQGPAGELVLYRDSHGHGGIACAGCHGPPHAVRPNPDPTANDNVTALQLQQAAGPVIECVVCHQAGGFPDGTLDGPHGLHPVGDPDWINSGGTWHRTFAGPPGDACAACHGVDHLGTRLSRATADRELRRADGTLEASVAEGEIVSCDLCHALARSF